MNAAEDYTQALADVRNPSTPPTRLQQIATLVPTHPELGAELQAHPQMYASLSAWVSQAVALAAPAYAQSEGAGMSAPGEPAQALAPQTYAPGDSGSAQAQAFPIPVVSSAAPSTEGQGLVYASAQPVAQLKENRGLLKYVLLCIVTLGIYDVVVRARVAGELNIAASRYDGQRTMSYYLLFFIVGPLTLGIGYFVWNHKICARLGRELRRRGISSHFSAADFWLWGVLGVLIIIGPFIYTYRMLHAQNAINADFNQRG